MLKVTLKTRFYLVGNIECDHLLDWDINKNCLM